MLREASFVRVVKLLAWTMSPIQAVVFDMDGLLIDTEPMWRQAEIDVFASVGLHVTEEQCLETMGVRVAQVVELWFDRYPWEGPTTEEITRRIEESVIERVLLSGEPRVGVLATLDLVHGAGLPIAIASSSSEEMIDAVVRRLGIRHYVEAICSADREPAGKPHPAVYLRAARELGVEPGDCLAFEDSPNGVLSAKAAGMFCIAIPDPYLASDPRMKNADMTLDSLEEFTPHLLAELTADNRTR
jgi:mannitol-1-/sugar-/sorbitol-6-/2-deoxyglucose-6-phosphatase